MNIKKGMFQNKTILIVGGSGSWGQELTTQLLLQDPERIIIFSRGELAQVNMEIKFNNNKLDFIIGDVRDYEAIDNIFKTGIDYVFHLAALKHVHVCEKNPTEAIKTNVEGVKNVIKASANPRTKKYIYVSTDKAVDPINLYGMTKGIGERLTIEANRYTKDTEFLCVRAGNVLGSSGSLVPLLIKQIQENNEVILTNGEMTRFFMLLPEAIELLLFAVDNGLGGEIYVMNMSSFYIKDFVDVFINSYGNGDTKIKSIGGRPGEKLHEMSISSAEVIRTSKVHEGLFVVYPQMDVGRTNSLWNHFDFASPISIHSSFTSENKVKDMSCLIDMLARGGFLK